MAGEDAEKDVSKEQSRKPEVETPDSGGEGSPSEADNAGEGAGSGVDALIAQAVAEALAEQQDSVLRARAEIQNMRRRCEMDVEKAHKFALEKFSAELLPVIDNLERALESVAEAGKDSIGALKEGVELTLKGFLETCEKFNLKQLNPVGEPFDPRMHQAISTVANDEVEPNTVLVVVQKGYLLNERVVRPAMVMVSKSGQG